MTAAGTAGPTSAADAASENPASRKLPEPIEAALDTLVHAAIALGPQGVERSIIDNAALISIVDQAREGVRAAVRPNLFPAEITPEIEQVLGTPNFRTGPAAHLFRAAGAEIKRHFEEEQAYVLFLFLRLALRHGEDWWREADRLLAEAHATIEAKKAGEGAAR